MIKTNFNEDLLIEHLAGMVRFPTVSDADPDKMDFEPFFGLHTYLEKTYPLVHATLQKTVIGRAALLYRWEGTGENGRLPLLLAAHQDVVPTGDPAAWKYPPFAGVIEDGTLWGRGCGDCKSKILAHMEAIEELIKEGFRPTCDVYLAYGYNEEVTGPCNSAAMIRDCLREQGIRLGCVIDEGGGIGPDPDEGISRDVAYIYTAEKGYTDIAFTIRDEGGHSMAPGRRSIVAELGLLAARLHEAQYPFRLTDTLRQEYESKAPYMDDPEAAAAFSAVGTGPEGLAKALPYIESDRKRAAKFHTTMALTMLEASERSNILPTRVQLVMNCRLQEGDTVDALMEKCRQIAGDGVEVTLIEGREHTAISRTDSDAYRCICAAIEQISPGTPVIPSVIGGGTDARNYYPICDSVYRFGGYLGGTDGNAHNFNEYFHRDGCSRGPQFFSLLLQEYGGRPS